LTVIGESKIIQRYKITFPVAVQRVLEIKPSDIIEYVLEEGRVYLRKKREVAVRRLEKRSGSELCYADY